MKTINKELVGIGIALVICGHTITKSQPAISMSTDSSGHSRTFLASTVTVPDGVQDLLYMGDTNTFTCSLIQPIKGGDTIPAMMSEDQWWSAAKTPLLIGTNKVQIQYPVFGMLPKCSDGIGKVLLPAVMKIKSDIKAGEVIECKGTDRVFAIETARSLKAGDTISVLLMNGPAILSVEAASGSEGSDTKPLLTVFGSKWKPEIRRGWIEAWRTEREYVSK